MVRKNIFCNILTKEYLYDQYVSKKQSSSEIGKVLGCSPMTVLRYLRLFGFTARKSLRHGDISKNKYGMLTPIDRVPFGGKRNIKTKWICKCDCGNTIEVMVSRLIKNQATSCGCLRKGRNNRYYKGTFNISKSYWNSIVRSAKERNYDFLITIKDAEEQFVKQSGMCNLSGIKLIPCVSRHSSGEWTASLDRIDSNLGYIKENIQWIHKDINRMKWHYNQDYFIELCHLISKTRKN